MYRVLIENAYSKGWRRTAMHVVFGANGRVGGETARALIERGEPVRVAVRRPEQGEPWKALGADVAVASHR